MVRHCPGVRLSAASFASLLCLLDITVPSAAKSPQLPCAADPFADPKTDPCNPLKYIASNALTSVAFGGCSDSNFSSRVTHPQLILGLVIATALVQTWYMFRIDGRFMSSMVIGEYSEWHLAILHSLYNTLVAFAIGIATRFGLHSTPDAGEAIYIVEYPFVVLSPCAFIVADYVLLGRMSRHLDCAKYLMIPARRVTIIFILSYIATFLIQVSILLSSVQSYLIIDYRLPAVHCHYPPTISRRIKQAHTSSWPVLHCNWPLSWPSHASTSFSFTAYAGMLQRSGQKMLGKNGIKIGEHSAAHFWSAV